VISQGQARRARLWFAAIAFAMLGAGWCAGYLQAVIVRECFFNIGCVREVLIP